jgi:ADP-heptose:LPS heptosyltransferase
MPQISPPVLIIRLDGIGDALALTPLLWALRKRAIPVDLVLCEANAGIFAPNAVRAVEVAPFALRSTAADNLARIDAFAARLATRDYGSTLIASEDSGAYRLARAIGTPQRAGFANGWGKPLKTLWVRSILTRTIYRPAGLDRRGLHECEVLFGLGGALLGGAQPVKDASPLRELVLEHEVTRGRHVAVQITEKFLRFGASAADVASLVKRLARRHELRAIAAEREASFADDVAASSGVPVERFEELERWKDAIAAARALVAPDSGATHVAGMVGTPTVAIFGVRPPFDRQVARWHPWAAPYRAICVESEWAQRVVASLDALIS